METIHTMESEMPFGKYKGKKLKELDVDYVFWIIKQDWFKGELREFIFKNRYAFDVVIPLNNFTGGDMMTGSLNEGY